VSPAHTALQSGGKARWTAERHLILWGFALAVGILAFAGWESYQNTVRFTEASEWRKHTYEVLRNLDETIARLVDAETGQRGYLLTGDETYLEPYRAAIQEIRQTIGRLKNLTSDNPNQQKRTQILEPLVEEKLAELRATIDLRKKEGLAAANRVVQEGSGKHWMDQIRALVTEMTNEEEGLLKVRTQRTSDGAARSVRTILAGTVLSISLLVVCFGLLQRELSERKKAQEATARSERWFSTTLASIGDAVIATDMNGVVSFMNSAAESLTGWSQAEARGKSMDLVFDIVNKETRRPVENPVKKVFREGKVVGLADHTLLLSKDGKEFEIEDSAAPILADTGEGFGVVLVFRDVTETKRADEETKRQKELFQLVLASVADGVVVADANGKFLLFNAAAEQMVGMGAMDVPPDQWSDQYGVYQPDGVTQYPANELPLVRAARGENVEGVEIFIRNAQVPEGRLLGISGAPLRSEDGTLRGGVVVFRDVTELKRADEALRQSEERYHLLFDSNPHPVWVYDLNTLGFLDVNRSAIQSYGYSREEFLSLTIRDIRPPEDVAALLESAATAPPATETVGVWRHLKKDGTLIDVEITSHPLVYNGKDARLVVATDITERKRTEEALVKAKEEAQRASKFKDQFLSTMSHELRTPLNAVLGFSDLLADERYGTLNERQKRYVRHVHSGGTHLLTLITDILDLSKIEAGRMEIVREDVSVASAFAEVLSTLQPLADKKSQSLAQQVAPNLYVRADITRFKQILMNLVGNAIKFTPEGGRIELAARPEGGQVRVEVRDNGPGIAPEEQKRIFEAFVRLTQTGSATEGTGLGLTITARLVELHGSKLEIESKPGEGTCFHFSLPLLATAPDEPAPTAVATRRAGKTPRILVVENDAATGQLIESQLAASGYETLRCDQPERAAEMAAEHQPHAITLDLLMQPVHGLEVLLQLKSDPRTSRIPVIVVTIVDQPGVGMALGADEYLVKPVDKARLLAAVERCLKSRGGTAPARAILVVEDDASTREMIEELLTTRGYTVIAAADGAEARARVAHALPELVILDLVLPKTSGLELLAEWRSSPRTADLPVFVLTSKDLTKEEEKYVHAHAESLFRKQHSWREPLMKQLERVGAMQIPEDAS
jgi:PAS domain S-box-containing protein